MRKVKDSYLLFLLLLLFQRFNLFGFLLLFLLHGNGLQLDILLGLLLLLLLPGDGLQLDPLLGFLLLLLLGRNGLQLDPLLGLLFLLNNRFCLFKLNFLWSFGFLHRLLLDLLHALLPIIGLLDLLLLFLPRAIKFNSEKIYLMVYMENVTTADNMISSSCTSPPLEICLIL